MTSQEFAKYAAESFWHILSPNEELTGGVFANRIRANYECKGANEIALRNYLCAKAAEMHLVSISRSWSGTITYSIN